MINSKRTPPLFIIGNPRSGTSLLRLIISNHSDVIIPPECGFIIWLYEKYKFWNIESCLKSEEVDSFCSDLLASKKFDTWQVTYIDVKETIQRVKPENYSDLCASIYLLYSNNVLKKKVTMWGDKNNFHIDFLKKLYHLYPEAMFLHIVRDGRDIACSYREVMASKSNSPYAPILNTNIRKIAEEWSKNVMKVDSFFLLLPDSAVKTIRYEDLVSQPQQVLEGVCYWMGIQFQRGMIDFHKENRKRSLEPELTIDWKKRTLLPISTDTVGRFEKLISKDEIVEFEDVANEALQKFLYTPL